LFWWGNKEGAGVVRNSLLVAAVFIAFLFSSGNANASGHIYLLRELAGIFSTGLDVLDPWSRRSNFHGGQNEEFGRSGRSGRDIRSNDESGSAIQCIPGYQLLYRQNGCFYGAGFQRMISNVDLNGTADINHSMLKRAIASRQRYLKSTGDRWSRTCRTNHETGPSKLSCCRTMNARD
jgi:hypothetical protein